MVFLVAYGIPVGLTLAIQQNDPFFMIDFSSIPYHFPYIPPPETSGLRQISAKNNSINDIVGKMLAAESGEHYVIVYPNTEVFRLMCSRYAKEQLENNNCLIVLLPYYDTVDRTISELERNGIDTRRYGLAGFLIVRDSHQFYLGSSIERDRLVKQILDHALVSRKSTVSIIADMGAFFMIDEIRKTTTLKIKGFCAYHKRDFDNLSEDKRKALFTNNYRALEVRH